MHLFISISIGIISLLFFSIEGFSQTNYSTLTSDSLKIKLKAINLSEDFSRLSTKNDELHVLIYPINRDSIGHPILSLRQTLRKKDTLESIISFCDSLLFVLVEEDHPKPIHNLSEIIRINYKSIHHALIEKDYNTMEYYIKDEDILFMEEVCLTKKSSITLNLKGIHRLDFYRYELSISKK